MLLDGLLACLGKLLVDHTGCFMASGGSFIHHLGSFPFCLADCVSSFLQVLESDGELLDTALHSGPAMRNFTKKNPIVLRLNKS